ncbi:hypothetical protein CONPUDRAFT_161870 [Coniophora puteana RWD-64-598 SS2]|uniref:F-box domain-containing protein n=1 Tax=Coniophora puteana (strain RWD-64-598) TaxID=741705 RepID=A0A5M3N771_CONPW|nr:uncharacterized protein CONPUDRAFT_161870 [Coniophora puteana RWD-64-598 SS2]EIW87300.1 hypothetical protein CONPUDRAFT_161870 [Coniophora puteana RWD-64-598 SS2]
MSFTPSTNPIFLYYRPKSSEGAKSSKEHIKVDNAGTPAGSAQHNDERVEKSGMKENSRPRKSKGRLKMLPSMPLDILFEIFGRLTPPDLLHLSRTTKPLRCILMHRSAVFVWKDALANVPDLPAAPEGMSQPKFASLMYDAFCHGCLVPGVRTAYFTLHIRLCNKCLKKHFEPLDRKFHLRYGAGTEECLARDKVYKMGDQYCCLIKEREAIVEVLQKLDREERAKFRQEETARVQARTANAEELNKWLNKQSESRGRELASIREERQEAIEAKLEELGWKEEIDALPDFNHWEASAWCIGMFEDHPHVKNAKPLTERIWANIKDDMIAYMEEMKQFRLKYERHMLVKGRQVLALQAYNKHQRANPISISSTNFWPGGADFLVWDRVKAIIEQPTSDALTENDFSGALSEVYPWMQDWCHTRIHQLMYTDPLYAKDLVTAGDRALQLATAVFMCTNTDGRHTHKFSYEDVKDSSELMWYPEYLHHRCNRTRMLRYEEYYKHEDIVLGKGYYCNTVQRPWSAEYLQPAEKARKIVTSLLKICGLSVATTTAEYMDQCDVRFLCVKCNYGRCDGEREVTAWTWRDAISHSFVKHFGSASLEWEVLSYADTDKLRLSERPLKEREDQAKAWQCARCHDLPSEPWNMTKQEVIDHLDIQHAAIPEDVEEIVDFVRAPDAPPALAKPVRCKPKAAMLYSVSGRI